MYNKKYVGFMTAGLILGLFLAFTMFWGCSSNSSGPTIIQGDLNDPQFAQIRTSLDNAVDSMLVQVFNPLANQWNFPLDTADWQDPNDNWWLGPMGDDDSIDYEYTDDGWHVLYVVNLTAAGTQVFYDSLAYYVDGVPWMLFASDVDEIKYRGSYETEFDDGQIITTLNYVSRVDLDNVNTTTAAANGTLVVDENRNYTDNGSDVEENFNLDAVYSDFEFTRTETVNWDTYTGMSGTVTADLEYTQTVDDVVTESTLWNVEIVFGDESAEIKVTKDNTQWTYELNL